MRDSNPSRRCQLIYSDFTGATDRNRSALTPLIPGYRASRTGCRHRVKPVITRAVCSHGAHERPTSRREASVQWPGMCWLQTKATSTSTWPLRTRSPIWSQAGGHPTTGQGSWALGFRCCKTPDSLHTIGNKGPGLGTRPYGQRFVTATLQLPAQRFGRGYQAPRVSLCGHV